MNRAICVCGAGTMGSGIAQVSAQSKCKTILFDPDQLTLEKAKIAIDKNLSAMVERDKITEDDKEIAFNYIHFTSDIKECIGEVVIEAIVEKIETKAALFRQLEDINSNATIFATNTSSLSVTAIAGNLKEPSKIAGMHFFNPAHIMKLVEVVKAEQTSETTLQTIYQLSKQFGKTPVICKDAPGFIVNRVARHYYLEALRLVEGGIADFKTVDDIMEASGFKMGPFRLMDIIGNDINLAVSQSLYEAFNKAERFKPSSIQEQKVENGELGVKTGKGYYSYQ